MKQTLSSLLACVLLCSCSAGESQPQSATDSSPAELTPVVLVKVNGEAITAEQLEHSISSTFSAAAVMAAGSELRDKVLESLIASKAMSQAALAELNSDDQQLIALKVAAYREELLVKAYLREHVAPQPVTSQMVEEYYAKHPELFGAEELVNVELLVQPEGSQPELRSQFLGRIESIRNEPNWGESTARWDALDLSYQKQHVSPTALSPRLQMTVNSLQEGETSEALMVDGAAYLVRLHQRRQVPPKPLSQVSTDIRKRLAPIQLKKAVKEASALALKSTTVEWPEVTP